MTRVNLLPWRQARREEQQREFIAVLTTSLIAVAALLLVIHVVYAGRISYQKSRNNYLRGEIGILDKKIKDIKTLKQQKQQLIARMRVIQDLQARRSQVVRLFHQVAEILPKGVFLESMVRKGDQITLKGKTESNTNISRLMRGIESSPWLHDPLLTEIKTQKKGSRVGNEFFLQLFLNKPINKNLGQNS